MPDSENGLPESVETDHLAEFLREHFPNYVTEGVFDLDPTRSTQRTRVKCDGQMCDFYAEDPSWSAVRDKHAQHVADAMRRALPEPDNHHNAALCPYCAPAETRPVPPASTGEGA